MEQMKTLTVCGETYEVTDGLARELLGQVDLALDAILALQETLMGGETV